MPFNLSASSSGYYTNQAAIESLFGVYNVAQWSNRDNKLPNNSDGSPQADANQIATCLAATDTYINYLAGAYNYVAPIPATSTVFGYLGYLAAIDAGCNLYFSRGLLDQGQRPDGEAGRMQGFLVRARGDKTKRPPIIGEIERIFKNGIPDAAFVANVTNAPAVVLSPVVAPYGSQPNLGGALPAVLP